MTELLEHKWLNEGVVPDVPLDSPSIIVADEVGYYFFLFLAMLLHTDRYSPQKPTFPIHSGKCPLISALR